MGKLTLSPPIKKDENKRWDWTSNPAVPGKQAIVCSHAECNKAFNEPIKLTVSAKGSLQTYLACPHCFSRLSDSDNLKEHISRVLLSASATAEREPAKDTEREKPFSCAHFLGYLNTRQKDTPIPDACLTCSRILKCM